VRTAAVDRGAGAAGGRPLPVADSGGGWLGSFLEGLFGLGPKSEPRRSPRLQDRGRWREREPRPTPVQPAPPAAPGGGSADAATYRTMCVRMCDGYYWPLSFATTMDNFARDERTCSQSCSSTVALYYYRNPGGQAEDMVNLRGVPYKNLGTAFLHRTTYDPNCKCRPHPWEAEAAERHKSYASPASSRAVAQTPRTAR
jgi:hypothetical protein